MDLFELEERARELIPSGVYDYAASGAEDEITLRDNLAAWTRLRLRPRILRGAADPGTGVSVLGTPLAAPIMVAPSARHSLIHPEGERATARGTAAAGSLMVVSTFATTSLEDVAAAAEGAPLWFQLYITRDRGWTAELVARAAAAGYRAICLTADLPVAGLRARAMKNPFVPPPEATFANAGPAASAVTAWQIEVGGGFDPGLSIKDLEWLRSITSLPLVVKGVLRADDAVRCADAGAAGVVVSNHGGRQLDTAIATAVALPEVVGAVGDRIEVYVDGGIRRGNDVLKALALGARAVLVGRPPLWGLATGGAIGVTGVLELLRSELVRSMSLCGARSLDELGPDLIAS